MREIDKAGNEGAIASLSFTLDTIGPVAPTLELDQVSVAASGDTPALTRTGSLTVKNLEATTNAKWKYRIDGGTWQDQTADSRISVTNPAGSDKDGTIRTVEVYEIDKAGNDGAVSSIRFKLDTTAPTKAVLSNAGITTFVGVSYSKQRTVSVDAGLDSSATLREYQINGGDWTAFTGSSFVLPGDDGNKRIVVRQTDAAGNQSTSEVLEFKLDTAAPVAPTLELDQISVAASGSTPALTRTGSVSVKNLEATTNAKWQYRIDGGTWQDQTSNGKISVSNAANADKNGAVKTVEVREIDKAGNEGAIASLSFTLDTTAPVAPTLELDQVSVAASGNTPALTRTGSVTVKNLEATANAKWQYRIDGGTWQDQTSNGKISVSNAANADKNGVVKTVEVREIDKAGNEGAIASINFKLDTTAPTKAVLSNAGITTFVGDSVRYSKDRTISVTGLDDSATLREYQINGLGDWVSFTGSSFNLPEGNDGAKSVVVRQTDAAGNQSTSEALAFTLDTTAPTAKPEVTLVKDTGRDANDKNTSNGTLKISITNLEAGGGWQWSGDNGATWNNGPTLTNNSAEISLTGEGRKLFKVRVLDRLGNTSDAIKVTDNTGTLIDANVLDFTLDTTVSYPTFTLTGQDRAAAKFTYSGTGAEANATITLKSGTLTLGTTTASATGAWSMEVRGSLRVSGLLQADGRSSNANGIYTLVTAAEAARLSSTNAFSNDFVATGTALLNSNREVYSMTRDGQTWYVWAPLNGDFIISRTTGSDEWYQGARDSDRGTHLYVNSVTTWNANSGRASDIQAQRLLNNGVSANSRRLEGVEVYGAFGNQNGGTVYTQQTDVAGNVTLDKNAVTSGAPTSATVVIAGVDLDEFTEGIQTSASRIVATSTMALGILGVGTAFAPAADAYVRHTTDQVYKLKVIFGGSGLDVVNDKLLLHSEMALNSSWSASGVSFGTATNLRFNYDANTRTLIIDNATGAAFASNDVLNPIIRSIRLKNVFATPGDRTMTVSLADASNIATLPATATLSISNDALWIDLDPVTAGTQFNSTRYVTSASNLVSGVTFDNQIAAPSAIDIRGLEVKLSGAGLDIANDKLKLDIALNLASSLATVRNKTIGGIAGLSYSYDASLRTLNIVKTAGTALTGAEVKSIVEALALSNTAAKDGERVAELRLFQADGTKGVVSTTRLILDTQRPPILDLDDSTGGIQADVTTTVAATSMAAGTGLLPKNIALAAASDIQNIRLEYFLAAGRTLESLGIATTGVDIPLIADSNGTAKLSGIPQLRYTMTAPSGNPSARLLTLSKSSGEALNSIETKAILDALRLKSTSTDLTDRLFQLTLTDMAGNTSIFVRPTLRIDTRTAPTLSASKVETGNQISFGMLTLNDNLGDTSDHFKHNLAPGESVTLPLPPGFTRETFLTALKAISSDWGGPGISGSADSILSQYRSYTTFGATPVIDSPIAVPHQSHTNVKGVKVKFTTVNGDLKLKSDTSFHSLTETDMYRFDGTNTKNEGAYDMGNIRLLYQTTTTSANSTPTIAVTYGSANVRIGDVIALYEDNKLLASKTLDSADVASGTLNLKVNTSLSEGEHKIVSKYTSTSGATSQTVEAVTVNVGAEMKVPVLTDLKVKASYDADAKAKPVLLDGKSYTSVTDPGNNGVYDKGLIFTGRINTPELAGKQKYLVSISLGGKTLGFDIFELETTDNASTSSFTLQAGSNLLAPGLYRDLTVAVTNVTEGSAYSGQTSVIKDAALGWYWAAQSMGNIRGGNGNDDMILSAPASSSSTVTTGAGADTLMLGAFGKTGNFSATVTDFQLGLDKVLVAGQTITAANFNSFVQSVAAGPNNSTTLTVDLDGAGSRTQTYTLTLQNLLYNPANTQTIFGV
ncbi:hypothetical protein [Herbaspirillum sp. B65]|uniref:hypothetical protein n=1 Tax=Herbaspirillum sp. B65 TaxID=137708 RepID=UPI001C2776E2|nr:hypothetical protein [Herbaspirillum sp. B65]